MSMEDKGTNFALIAIVAIVAIIALVILLKTQSGSVVTTAANAAGRASFAYVLW